MTIDRFPWRVPAIVAAAILCGGFVATVAVDWPGHLSYDSILQLLQGRTGQYNTWHPPVMAWLLGLGDAVVPGTGLFVLFDAVLGFGAFLTLLLAAWGRADWAGAAVALIVVLLPQMLMYQGLVWKDVLFADAAVAGFVCLAQAAANWSRPRPRALLFAAAGLVLLVLAALARQNGLVLLPFAAGALGWIAATQGWTWRRAALLGAGALVGLVALVFGANALLGLRSDGESGPTEQFHLLQVYDLSGAVARDPNLPLATMADDDPDLEHAIRTDGARHYTPARNDPISEMPSIDAALSNADTDALDADWQALILHRPWLYLQVRATDFAWVLFTPDIVASRPVFTGIEGPAEEMNDLGIKPRHDARDLALAGYSNALLHTPVFSHGTFLVVTFGMLWVLLRRRRPADIAMAAMLGGALAFVASFFVISISCDYRYLLALDLCAMAALFYGALDWRDLAKRR